MAILSGPPGPKKPIALKGVAYVTTYRGRVVLRAWPKKRKRPLHPHTQEQSDRMAQAAVLAKYLDANQQIQAREATKGTPLYYRDILEMAMFGTDLAFIQPNGRILYSVATRQGVSESLDVLSQEPRTILVRDGSLWVPVTTTKSGQVPVSQSAEPFVQWQDPPGPGGSGSTLLATQSAPVSGMLTITGLTLPTTGQIQIRIDNLTVQNGNGSVWLRIQQAGSFTATGYYWRFRIRGSDGTDRAFSQVNFTVLDLTGFGTFDGVSPAANASLGSVITFPSLDTTKNIPVWLSTAYQFQNGASGTCLNGGAIQNPGAMTGFRLVSSAGNILTGKMTIIHLG